MRWMPLSAVDDDDAYRHCYRENMMVALAACIAGLKIFTLTLIPPPPRPRRLLGNTLSLLFPR